MSANTGRGEALPTCVRDRRKVPADSPFLSRSAPRGESARLRNFRFGLIQFRRSFDFLADARRTHTRARRALFRYREKCRLPSQSSETSKGWNIFDVIFRAHREDINAASARVGRAAPSAADFYIAIHLSDVSPRNCNVSTLQFLFLDGE